MTRRELLKMLAGAAIVVAGGGAGAPEEKPESVFVEETDVRGFFRDGRFVRVYQRVWSPEGVRLNPDYVDAPLTVDIWKRGGEYELRVRERGVV